jgi:hypothetical protein
VTRSEFGLVAELKQEMGSMLIGDDITLDLEAEATLLWRPVSPTTDPTVDPVASTRRSHRKE